MSLYAKLEKAKNGSSNLTYAANMGEILSKYIARESVQTFDYGIRYTGLGKSLSDITKSQLWEKLLANTGYSLSLCGKNQALILELVNGVPFIDGGELTEIVRIGNKTIRAAVNTKELIEINGQEENVYVIFEWDKGAIYRYKAYVAKAGWIELEDTRISLPWSEIPVFELWNNALGLPDIPDEVQQLIKNLNWLSDDLIPEWVASSTQWIKNMTFGSTETAEEVFQNSLDHKKIHEGNDPDNKASMGIGPVSLGTQSIINLTAVINYIEDKILKYSMQFREVAGGGTNKHNLEISSQNKQAFEYMLMKLDWRQKQLSNALTLFQRLISEKIDEETSGDVSVVIEVPELEKFKMDNMQAQVDNLKAQSKNQKGQAKSWEASAEQIEKGENPQANGGE